MSLLDRLTDPATWEEYYSYKASLCCPKSDLSLLRDYIDQKKYLLPALSAQDGKPFPHPRKSVISKLSSSKKRTVYTYPDDENRMLKLLTFLLLRKYDRLFSPSLYSFRPAKNAKDAVRYLRGRKIAKTGYFYKADIHDYFNSVPVELLLPMLRTALEDDPDLFGFLSSLLCDPYVIDKGQTVSERKGIMAGTPVSAFFANLFLSDLDREISGNGILYARYSDDVILFTESEEKTAEYAELIRKRLSEKGLEMNPAKESFGRASDGFVFLGFLITPDKTDVAPATLVKLKHKMRRKANALHRWQEKTGADGDRAAAAFIRVFNRKLLESPEDNELSWSYWFFSVITTDESLHKIDLYAQDCIRFIASGKHTKKRFDLRYEDMKKLGYRSLVHEYYRQTRPDGEKTPD